MALAVLHTRPNGCRLAAAGLKTAYRFGAPIRMLSLSSYLYLQGSKFRPGLRGHPYWHIEVGIR